MGFPTAIKCLFILSLLNNLTWATTAGTNLNLANTDQLVAENQPICGFTSSQAQQFEQALRLAQKANNPAQLANFFYFPLWVNQSAHSHFWLKSRQDFIKRYPQIFTPKLKQSIISSKFDYFCNDQGGMLGNGIIWYAIYGKKIQAFALNTD